MGEVYRARDTRLHRDIALKILPEAFTSDSDRLARFKREAQVLASLNHQNIAGIHGLEESDGVRALVLELVEGPTLADRIAQGPIPLDEALPFARQIAEALEAAHEQGIVHRDLKPANVKVRPDGTVKLLDFGLAKLVEPVGSDVHTGPAEAQTDLPTLSAQATRAGAILGTAAYMSPEQALGKLVDRRADIWAFGCVLFELLTGRKAFDTGASVSDAIEAILTKQPDWRLLPDVTPPQIRMLIRRCLQKDPRKRLPHIGVATLEIDEALTAPHAEPSLARAAGGHPRAALWAVTVVSALAAMTSLVLWGPWRTTPARTVQRLSVELGTDASLLTRGGAAAVLSPDGQTLAFVAQTRSGAQQLYVRRLDELRATPLAGTDGARDPFFSPDGSWIAFLSGADDVSKLRKIAVAGGAAVTLCEADVGGAWGDDGTIVFSPEFLGGLARVSENGGTPTPITTLGEGELTHRWPQLLPDGKAVLYTASNNAGSAVNANLVLQSLPNGPRQILFEGATYGRYLPSGHLVYVHDGTLYAASFDAARLELTGSAVPVLKGVTTTNSGRPAEMGGAQFAIANSGALVYQPGQSLDVYVAPVVWMDQKGRTSPLRGVPAAWADPQFSPNGRLLLMDISAAGNHDVWVYDPARDALSRLTTDPGDDVIPIWTPDGRRITFSSTRGNGTGNLYWQRSDGTGEVQRLTESQNRQFVGSWHPSGKILAFWELNQQTGRDLMMLSMEGGDREGWRPGKPTTFLKTPFGEAWPVFSPDGKWLAYASNESGRNEVYVRPFPDSPGKWQISTDGGTFPIWSRTRAELLFEAPDERVMVASYSAEGASFRSEKPRPWTEERFFVRTARSFDLHPDGQRLAVAPIPTTVSPAGQDKVVFIFNFLDELRRIVPPTSR